MIPFTVDQFLNVFEQYNVAVWPAQRVIRAPHCHKRSNSACHYERDGYYLPPQVNNFANQFSIKRLHQTKSFGEAFFSLRRTSAI
jgi:hypothetical protein